VSQFQSKVYSGQYSNDGSFFYTASQDFNVYIYDTRTPPQTGSKSVTDNALPMRRRAAGNYWQHRSSLKTLKVVKAHERNCRWTITDASVSSDDKWLVYSSITPRVHLVQTGEGSDWDATDDHDQSTLDFAAGMRGSPSFGVSVVVLCARGGY
jgi:WD repeat-containing protein 23